MYHHIVVQLGSIVQLSLYQLSRRLRILFFYDNLLLRAGAEAGSRSDSPKFWLHVQSCRKINILNFLGYTSISTLNDGQSHVRDLDHNGYHPDICRHKAPKI